MTSKYVPCKFIVGTGKGFIVTPTSITQDGAHHPDCPTGQMCWCPAGQLVPGYADSPDGLADAADQARWDTR